MLRRFFQPRLRARAALPHLDAVEHHAWLEGLRNGIGIGAAIGFGLAVILLKA